MDALLELIEEGDLHPTATRIAERAGISLRLIYHHFGDLESLFRAASERQTQRIAEAIEAIPLELALGDRIDALVAQRSVILEWITPVRRAAQLQEPYSDQLRDTRLALQALGVNQVATVFDPELGQLAPDERHRLLQALGATLGWGFWNELREGGASVEGACVVVAGAGRAQLDGAAR